jgi:Holliday junction DNA helicase RuvA
MIGFLRGTLVSKHPPALTVDVGGVGYELEAPMSTFYKLPEAGQPVNVLTHFLVREDAHTLYGFATDAERALFRNLLKVSGVGARVALAILSGITVDGFRDCVMNKDVATLVRLPGIGRKTAERLLVEMADRLPEASADAVAPTDGAGTQGEAFNALLALGYKPAEVTRMLKEFDTTTLSTEDMIKQALRRAAG